MRGVSARFSRIDWSTWVPREEATLLYVVREHRILLIHKKRGIGAGKLNGAGGRMHDGESPLEAAVRECREELSITPVGAEKRGEVWFQVVDGTSLRIHVFLATEFQGEPRETSEAIPYWAPVDGIPYDRMWADDRLWLPRMLRGERFAIRTLFDGDTLLGYDMDCEPASEGKETP